jgi:hypothetical protein
MHDFNQSSVRYKGSLSSVGNVAGESNLATASVSHTLLPNIQLQERTNANKIL